METVANTGLYLGELTDRYQGLLTAEEIRKISEAVILIAGCGVGSAVAEEAARMGFSNFILADADTVSVANLGRQRYGYEDLGENKAKALEKRIKSINPYANVVAHPVFITPDNIADIIAEAIVAVDAIDPGAPLATISLHREARKRNMPVVLPADVGWGAKVFVFSGQSTTFEEMLGLEPNAPLQEIDQMDAMTKTWEYLYGIAPDYVRQILEKIADGQIGNYPQPSSAASIVAGLAAVAMKRLALGQYVALAPNNIGFDPELAFQKEKDDG